MKKVLIVLIFILFFMGLGGVGEEETKLPKLKDNFKVELTDSDGYKIALENVSFSEVAYLSGNAGRGKQIIELNRIKKIEMKPTSTKEVAADIYLKNNDKIRLMVQGHHTIKGKSKFGVFSIKVSDVKEIIFLD